MKLARGLAPVRSGFNTATFEGDSLRVERDGILWTLKVQCRPGAPETCELVSTVVNQTCGGVALPGWGAGSGLYFHLIASNGQKIFDSKWDSSSAITVIERQGHRVTKVALGRRPLMRVVDWSTPPLKHLTGFSDPLLAKEDHLWLIASLHNLRGETLRLEPLLLPLSAWRKSTQADSGPAMFSGLNRLRQTELIYHPGSLLCGFGREIRLQDAKSILKSRGVVIRSERLYGAIGFLIASVPAGRETTVAKELEAEGLVRVARREPIVCGLEF